MTDCSVTLTANAGILLEWKRHAIWIDALHDQQIPSFSAISPFLWAQMQTSLPPPEQKSVSPSAKRLCVFFGFLTQDRAVRMCPTMVFRSPTVSSVS